VTSQTVSLSGPDETRQRILNAAIHVFSEKGYIGATTRAIAAAAGVNEVTIFRHFGNKKNLLLAAVDYYSPLPGMERLIETEFTGDYRQDLLRLGNHFLEKLNEPWHLTIRRKILLTFLQEIHREPEMRGAILPRFKRIRHLLQEYLERQIEQKTVKELDAATMVEAILGMFFSYGLLRPLLDEHTPDKKSSAHIVSQFVEIFVEGTVRKDT
jgi:AcrR family transcriptional regulator